MNFVHVQKGVYINVNEEIAWSQWVTKKEKRMIKSEEKEIVITVNEETKGTIGYLLDNFHDQMTRYRIHTFNIWNQLKHYKNVKEGMKENEGMIHIDFAVNYQTKLGREIQSMHFGASLSQVTLHTCIYYNGKDANCTFILYSNR